MSAFTILAPFLALTLSAAAQVQVIPTISVTSNDVVQSSIMDFRMKGTNGTRVTVKFAFTDTGEKKLKEFYTTHSVGQVVRYQIGSFERVFALDDRKHFGREGFWGLSEQDAQALESGLRGRK